LRFRLENPLTGASGINQVHDALRCLIAAGLSLGFDRQLVDQVDRYLRSSDEPTSRSHTATRWLESGWALLRYPQFIRFAREGVAITQDLVRRTMLLVAQVRAADPPLEVRRIVDQIDVLTDRTTHHHNRPPRSAWDTLEADRWFREARRTDLLRLLSLVGELDALLAMAAACDELGLTLPTPVAESAFALRIEGVRHPFLPRAVPNPVSVTGGETLVFLTGPNMAGKTTYLKAVGIALHLAHCGMGVPAASMSFTPVDGLITSLRPEDNLRAGLSFFLAEVRRVAHVAQWLALGKRAFVIFDEIFRGTNVRDALEASKTVIRGLAKATASGFIISSHLTELADDLRDENTVRFAHFDGEILDGVAEYSFRIRDGVSRKRFGLQLLEQEHVPQLLAAISGRA